MATHQDCSPLRFLSLFLAFSVSAAVFVFVFRLDYPEEPKDYTIYIDTIEQFEVRGSSMAPLINPGQTVEMLYKYYDNHPVKREDIIVYDYAGNDVPIIKIVKAVPGDSWRLEKDENENNYQIIVNNEPLKNSEGEYYQISESKIKMLKNYAESYPLLPDDTYLILGNKIHGSMDATRFGLIGKNDILGKVKTYP